MSMATPQEIKDAIRRGLNSLPPASGTARKKERTEAIKARLCRIGRQPPFDCRVCAALPRGDRTYGEWLYDVVWLKYHEERDDHPICCVPLVAECEWGTYAHIKEDFQKLLLARATVRVMIYRDAMWHPEHGWKRAKWTAKRLAQHVRQFNPSSADDTWLLAAWRRTNKAPRFAFNYFSIRDGKVFKIRHDGTEDPIS